MPIFMDRHHLPNATAAVVAQAHALDLTVQAKHGVEFITYWYDTRTCSACCLVDAPDAETAIRVHAESHGELPSDIIEVDPAIVEAFMGRIADPEAAVQRSEAIAESAVRVVMFTDIVDSTGLTARLGDAGARQLIRVHDALVRGHLLRHGGREVKHLGDGIMASFAEAPSAVRCACAIQRGASEIGPDAPAPLILRIGMDAGEPVQDSNDLFGATVQLAARICADAAIDDVVLSPAVRDLAGEVFPLTALGRRMLKGFADPVPLFSVDWRAL